MKVKFNRLKITNFKGIKSRDITFSDETLILGANETGKSTIFDAITWCLFGKNSQDAKDFSIKNTIDRSLNRSDHEVELFLTVEKDGRISEFPVKRVFREKWTKRRGSEETEFTGHETLFFWNDVPCQAGEYQKKISELVDESLFKLLTNPLYFNVTLGWQQRRNTLIAMASNITDQTVIGQNKSYIDLFERLNGMKTLEEYKKEIAAKKIGLKKSLLDIPSRIDELLRSNPKTENWKEIEKEILSKQDTIKVIEKEIEEINTSFEKQLSGIKEQQTKIIEAKRKMSQIEINEHSKAYSESQTLNSETNRARADLSITRNELTHLKGRKTQLEAQAFTIKSDLSELRLKWQTENEKELTIDESKFACPTCGTPFKEENIEAEKYKMNSTFSASKIKNLELISAEGKKGKELIDNIEAQLKGIDIKALETKEKSLAWAETAPIHQSKEVDFSTNKEYQALKIESGKTIEAPTIDITVQKEMKHGILEGIDELKTILRGKDQIEKNNIRVEELKSEENKYAQELASLEKVEFTIDEFNKAKMTMIEASINDRFKIVKFKLFNTLINGGEEPTCETMVNNVPFSDVNHAGQINAGIDCINALSNHYGVIVPVVVDNSEAVNEILPTSGQMIKLYVTEDKELVIINN